MSYSSNFIQWLIKAFICLTALLHRFPQAVRVRWVILGMIIDTIKVVSNFWQTVGETRPSNVGASFSHRTLMESFNNFHLFTSWHPESTKLILMPRLPIRQPVHTFSTVKMWLFICTDIAKYKYIVLWWLPFSVPHFLLIVLFFLMKALLGNKKLLSRSYACIVVPCTYLFLVF